MLSTFTIPKWNTLDPRLGVPQRVGDQRHDRDRFPPTFSDTLNTLAFFGQDELSHLRPRSSSAAASAGRTTASSGSSLTGRASAALVIKETGSKLRFAWGQGFRAPTINDLFFPGFANPDLKPERSTSWEIGVDQRLWEDRIRFGATYFNQNFRNLIQFVFDPDHLSLHARRTWGARASRGWRPTPRSIPSTGSASTRTTRTWTPRTSTPNQELRRVPRNTINTGVTVTPFSRLTLFMQANVVSSQLESDVRRPQSRLLPDRHGRDLRAARPAWACSTGWS